VDRKKKFPATAFLRACGIESDAELLQIFFTCEDLPVSADNASAILRRICAADVVNRKTGEVLLEARHPVTHEAIKRMVENGISKVKVLAGSPEKENPTIWETLRKDSYKSSKEAQQEIYKKLRGQEFIVPGQAEQYLDNLLFKNLRKYDLSHVGRYKIEKKLGLVQKALAARKGLRFEVPSERRRTLTLEDLISTMQYIILLNSGEVSFEHDDEVKKVSIDDIDHLGNRRVRGVGELLENQIRVGLAQMSRVIRDRMSVQDKALLTPRTLLNTAPLVGILRKFFGTSQLSQFMDQINPLAELTHKRRLSALGPGGLNRKRAGFEVRDVHHTHYGRICPVETPEGTGDVVYMAADLEDENIVAQANAPLNGNQFVGDTIACRSRGDFPTSHPRDIDFMDVSPLQVVSVSTALIPFLEHDDANRALMGANMMRQAVPLLIPEAPVVGTGVEDRVAKDSGACVRAERSGKVLYSSGDTIAVNSGAGKKDDIDIYDLKKYRRSNQDTCINQAPIAVTGTQVKKGDILADGPAVDNGLLALGKNLLIGMMSWEGYNFEDAILVSERLIKDDVFTSVHISEFHLEARDTKLGPEEVTRDIPNVGVEALEYLDEHGIVIPSTNVGPGDILVGKVTPKGEQQLTPEERLLKVIFGKKAEDVQDASLRVPPGVRGKVIGVRVFTRREKITKAEERKRLADIDSRLKASLDALREYRKEQNVELAELTGAKKKEGLARLEVFFKLMEKKLRENAAREREDVKMGDELPVTVNKVVKVYIASKRKLQAGDKLAGRHGNKGVVAKILPAEDMPFLPDGTPLDMVLSPLGVPSRMNVGQLLEMMMGWAAHTQGVQAVCPVFDGAEESEIYSMIKEAKKQLKAQGIPDKYLPDNDCRTTLYDGRTGEAFEEKVTVGYQYILKLNHLVEDKIHARSTGPYSLITRQPLGGKAQFGGQRFGEMEVWAIEGYGAAYALQEFLTVKSDDVAGRTKMYESIVKGEPPQPPGVPESFKVLVKELQALSLDVELLKLDNNSANGAEKSKKPAKAAAAKG
jgi:DNA-directed RNA polymerase subunit beta